jgi:hypothetical protein
VSGFAAHGDLDVDPAFVAEANLVAGPQADDRRARGDAGGVDSDRVSDRRQGQTFSDRRQGDRVRLLYLDYLENIRGLGSCWGQS